MVPSNSNHTMILGFDDFRRVLHPKAAETQARSWAQHAFEGRKGNAEIVPGFC